MHKVEIKVKDNHKVFETWERIEFKQGKKDIQMFYN